MGAWINNNLSLYKQNIGINEIRACIKKTLNQSSQLDY